MLRLVVVVLALSLVPALAHAAPKSNKSAVSIEEQAQKLFAEGEAAYAANDFEAALESFVAAYEQIPVAALLFNIGQTHRKLGNHALAATFLQRYLDEETDTIPNRDEVAAIVAEETALAEQERVAAAAAATAPAGPAVPAGPKEPAIYEEPMFWGVAGGIALAAVVGGAVAIAVATAPLPAGTLGTFDLRNP